VEGGGKGTLGGLSPKERVRGRRRKGKEEEKGRKGERAKRQKDCTTAQRSWYRAESGLWNPF
jgi:hypothetical protein